MVNFKSIAVRALMGLFIIGALAAFVGVNASKPRVLILHSYDTEYIWVRDINNALNRKLGNKPYILRWHYMDTKRNPDDAFKQRSGVLARRIIDDWQPTVMAPGRVAGVTVEDWPGAVKWGARHPRIACAAAVC